VLLFSRPGYFRSAEHQRTGRIKAARHPRGGGGKRPTREREARMERTEPLTGAPADGLGRGLRFGSTGRRRGHRNDCEKRDKPLSTKRSPIKRQVWIGVPWDALRGWRRSRFRSPRNQRRLLITTRRRAIRDRTAFLLELEQRRLLRPRVRRLLLAAKLEDVAPQMALAVDLDEPETGHDVQLSPRARWG
jgi:hypothetical protein